jgi:hypothetical protein
MFAAWVFTVVMSLKEIYFDSGIAHTVKFNHLWQSWPIVMKSAEASGQAPRPVRIGTRRVVLATETPQPKRMNYLPISIALVVVASVAYLALNPAKNPPVEAVPVEVPCKPLEDAVNLIKSDDGFIYGNWSFSLTEVLRSGNVINYEFVASCKHFKSVGTLTASTSADGLRVKKLTPTN